MLVLMRVRNEPQKKNVNGLQTGLCVRLTDDSKRSVAVKVSVNSWVCLGTPYSSGKFHHCFGIYCIATTQRIKSETTGLSNQYTPSYLNRRIDPSCDRISDHFFHISVPKLLII